MPTPTQAWAEAQACASADTVELYSLEINHPTFPTPIRAVNDNAPDGHMLPLEDSSPVNPGETVLFQAIPFDTPWIEQRDGQVGTLKIRIDNIGREVMPYLDAAIGVEGTMTILFRCHLWSQSDGSVEIAMTAISLNLRSVTVTEGYVEGTASPADANNLQVIRMIYDVANYPQLVQ